MIPQRSTPFSAILRGRSQAALGLCRTRGTQARPALQLLMMPVKNAAQISIQRKQSGKRKMDEEPFEIPRSTKDSQALIAATKNHQWTLKNLAKKQLIIGNSLPIEESEKFFNERKFAKWKQDCSVFIAMVEDLCAAGIFETPAETLQQRIYCAEMEHISKKSSCKDPLPADWYNERKRLDLACMIERRYVMVFIDEEVVPFYNYQLLPEFAANSRGRFTPENIAGFDLGARFRVQFVQNGTLYFIDLPWNTSWRPDLIVAIVHLCFAQEHIRERFVRLYSDGPICEFIFVDPVAFAPIAKKFKISFTAK